MNNTNAKILMAALMVARSTSFIFSKTLMNDLSPLNILGVRFLLAFFILIAIFYKKIIALNKTTFLCGFILGLEYTVCMIFEMYGLRLIDTGVSSFIENAAIVIVPIYQAFLFRKFPKPIVLTCSIIAFIGIGFLSLSGGFEFNIGIVFAILAALTYAGCIMTTTKVSTYGDPITIGIIQLGTMGGVCALLSLFTGGITLPQNSTQWGMLMMLVIVCSCFGFTLQPLAQKYISTETAALFSAVNPMSTCIIGIIFASEAYGLFKMIGCFLILTGILIHTKYGDK